MMVKQTFRGSIAPLALLFTIVSMPLQPRT